VLVEDFQMGTMKRKIEKYGIGLHAPRFDASYERENNVAFARLEVGLT